MNDHDSPDDPSHAGAAGGLQLLEGGKTDAPDHPEPGAPPPFDPRHPYWLEHIENLVEQLVAIVRPFAPNIALEQYPAIAAYELQVQTELINPAILPAMSSGGGLHPCMHLRVTDQTTGKSIAVPVYKRIDGLRDPDQAVRHAMLLAFLLSPAARALLRMHLYSYDFFEADDPKNPRRPFIVKP